MTDRELSEFTTGDGCVIGYRIDGPANAPVSVLSNSIGTTHRMWDAQIDAFLEHFRVLRYDTRGHGASGVPPGPYSLDRLGYDVIELIDALGLDRVHFCGLSLGGYIGQWLGIHQPDRIDRLILANTAACVEPRSLWDANIADVLAVTDMEQVAQHFLRNWFPATMLDPVHPAVVPLHADLLTTDRAGFAGCYAVIRDADLRRTDTLISSETLVIAGQFDTVITHGHGELIASVIPGARLVSLPVVHMSNVEQPEVFGDLVLDFLTSRAGPS